MFFKSKYYLVQIANKMKEKHVSDLIKIMKNKMITKMKKMSHFYELCIFYHYICGDFLKIFFFHLHLIQIYFSVNTQM